MGWNPSRPPRSLVTTLTQIEQTGALHVLASRLYFAIHATYVFSPLLYCSLARRKNKSRRTYSVIKCLTL